MKKLFIIISLILIVFLFSGCVNNDDPDDSGNVVRLVNPYDSIESIGTEVVIGTEHFYVIGYTDDKVTLLAKYNLLVGNIYNKNKAKVVKKFDSNHKEFGDNVIGYGKYGLQSEKALGYVDGSNKHIGVVQFSSFNYWVFNNYNNMSIFSWSNLYKKVGSYKKYFEEEYDIILKDWRLIKKEELINLGCSEVNRTCLSAPSWVYQTSYWTESAVNDYDVWDVFSSGIMDGSNYNYGNDFGIRPVIVVSKSLF